MSELLQRDVSGRTARLRFSACATLRRTGRRYCCPEAFGKGGMIPHGVLTRVFLIVRDDAAVRRVSSSCQGAKTRLHYFEGCYRTRKPRQAWALHQSWEMALHSASNFVAAYRSIQLL